MSMRILERHVVAVDYDMSLKQMIGAGKYGHVYPHDIPERFLDKEKSGIHMIEIILVNFDEMITPQEAAIRDDMMEYRPVTIEELLALGAMQPSLQQRFHMVFLPGSGMMTEGGCYLIPYLGTFQRKRCFSFDWIGLRVGDACCFAFVHK